MYVCRSDISIFLLFRRRTGGRTDGCGRSEISTYKRHTAPALPFSICADRNGKRTRTDDGNHAGRDEQDGHVWLHTHLARSVTAWSAPRPGRRHTHTRSREDTYTCNCTGGSAVSTGSILPPGVAFGPVVGRKARAESRALRHPARARPAWLLAIGLTHSCCAWTCGETSRPLRARHEAGEESSPGRRILPPIGSYISAPEYACTSGSSMGKHPCPFSVIPDGWGVSIVLDGNAKKKKKKKKKERKKETAPQVLRRTHRHDPRSPCSYVCADTTSLRREDSGMYGALVSVGG